jgi:hypothetical protein
MKSLFSVGCAMVLILGSLFLSLETCFAGNLLDTNVRQENIAPGDGGPNTEPEYPDKAAKKLKSGKKKSGKTKYKPKRNY